MLKNVQELKELAKNQPWLIDEFVCVVNRILPNFLPETKGNEKIRDEVNARLIRHYATEGLLDLPQREGRNAVYTYRHLLQLLVVRRLLAEGIAANAINNLVIEKTNSQLEKFLGGAMSIEISLTNAEEANTNWNRLTIIDGLEIHVRSNLDLNTTSQEQLEELMIKITQGLRQYEEYNVMTTTVAKIYERFTSCLPDYQAKQSDHEKWEKEGDWELGCLRHMLYWVLYDRYNYRGKERIWSGIKLKTKNELKQSLFERAPDLYKKIS